MEFMKRMVTAVTSKQTEIMNNIENDTLELFVPNEPGQYFKTLPERFFRSITAKMVGHGQAIEKYFSKNIIENYAVSQIASDISRRQNNSLDALGNKLDAFVESKLDIDTYVTIERPVRIEKETVHIPKVQINNARPVRIEKETVHIPKVQINNARQSIEYSSSEKKAPSIDPPNNRLQSLSNDTKERQVSHHNLSPSLDIKKPEILSQQIVDRSTPFHQNKIHPEHQPMIASQFIVKRDVVKELQERRRKIQENDHKQKKLKTNLVKLDPIASKKEREIRSKEAKAKLLEGIEFVQSLHIKKQIVHSKPTEWRQQRIKTNEMRQKNSIKYSFKKLSPLRGVDIKRFPGHEGYGLDDSNVKKTERIVSRIDQGKNYILKKPIPYNVYNVNFKEEEFQLQYK